MKRLLLAGSLALGTACGALADFSGWYDTPPPPAGSDTSGQYNKQQVNLDGSRWTLAGSGVFSGIGTAPASSGGVDTKGFGELVVNGNNTAVGGRTLFTIPIVPQPDTPTLSFTWFASSLDASDAVGWYLNGTTHQLAQGPGTYGFVFGTGPVVVPVGANDIFGWYVDASNGGPGHSSVKFDITNFIAPVPEVSTVLANGLMLSALGGIVIYRRKHTAKNVS